MSKLSQSTLSAQLDHPLSVSALTSYLKYKFDCDPYLQQVVVVGEVTNFRQRQYHQYFAIKDDNAQIDIVMFARDFAQVDFELADGMKVIVVGHISVYQKNGNYSLYAQKLIADGVGVLYQQFLQQKKALAQAGLFAEEHKKSIPKFPKKIAVITSREGAVIRDIITTVTRRYPIVQLVLYPAVVQGDQAAASVAARLKEVNLAGGYDTIIVGRGGGSLEDLWAFNEEVVVRAIYASTIPVISSVGHETDTTLCDLASDLRAATPTAAAELATPVLTDVKKAISDDQNRLYQAFSHQLKLAKNRYAATMNSYVFKQPSRLYENYVQQLARCDDRLIAASTSQLHTNQERFIQLEARFQTQSPATRLQLAVANWQAIVKQMQQAYLHTISDKKQYAAKLTSQLASINPLVVLKRGYAVVEQDEKIIKSIDAVDKTKPATVKLSDGTLDVKVMGKHKSNEHN